MADRPASAQTVALWSIAVIAALFFLRSAGGLLIPIVLGLLISYALEPVVAWLTRHRVPRTAGATLLMIVIVGASAWGVYSLEDNIASAIEALPEAARRARELLTSHSGSGTAASLQQAADVLQGSSTGDQGTGGGGSRLGDILQRAAGSLFALAGHIVVVIFLIYFFLLSGHHLRDRIVEVSGPDRDGRQLAATIIDQANAQIQRFLLVRLVTAIIVGIATWGVLALLGVQNAAVWGILAGVFNSIPYFGPVIVSGGLLVVGLVQGGGATQALQMSGAALAITSLEGWLLTPWLMGRAERMSVLAVFLGLLLWTWLWGGWGTLLAVPMLVVIKSVADHVERLKPLGRLMPP